MDAADTHPDGTARLDASVVIPALDAAWCLDEQLDAIAAQDFPGSWEVVVADNGSADSTRELVRRRAATFPVPLHLVDASGWRGVGHARNVGARTSRGDVLAFCDADDAATPSWLREVVDAATEHGVVACLLVDLAAARGTQGPPLNPGCLSPSGGWWASFGIRRGLFFDTGGFDASLPGYGWEDTEYNRRLRAAGVRVAPAPRAVMGFRRTTSAPGLASKILRSGTPEAVMWHRMLLAQGRRLTRADVARDLTGLPRRLVAGRSRGRAALAREALATLGRALGWFRWVRPGDADVPRYVGPDPRATDTTDGAGPPQR